MKALLSIIVIMIMGSVIMGCGGAEENDIEPAPSLEALLDIIEAGDNYTLFFETIHQDGRESTYKIRVDGNSNYALNDAGVMKFETYVIEDENIFYSYSRVDQSTWQKHKTTPSEGSWLYDLIYDRIAISEAMLTEEDDATYSVKKAYFSEIFENDSDKIESIIIVLSVDSITMTVEGTTDSDIATQTYAIYNIASTIVGYPEGEIEAPDS